MDLGVIGVNAGGVGGEGEGLACAHVSEECEMELKG